MTERMRSLYEYTLTHRYVQPTCDPEYRSADTSAEIQEDRLRQMLDPEGCRALGVMLDELSLVHSLELEAMFQATLALSRELAGLTRP